VQETKKALLIISIPIGFLLFYMAVVTPLLRPTGFRPRSVSKNNLKAIGLALHRYHDDYSMFPPAFIADENGRPMHSWRVLLLPHLAEGHEHSARYYRSQLFKYGLFEISKVYERVQIENRTAEQIKYFLEQYRFDEPWDGPNNRKLHDLPAGAFHCPDGADPAMNTSCVAIVGEQTVWTETCGRKIKEITDGTSDTALVVEITDSGIHWLEPRDLQYDDLPLEINPKDRRGISSPYKHGAYVLLCDGSVRYVGNRISKDNLRRLLEISDGELLEEF